MRNTTSIPGKIKHYYAIVSEAINELESDGYTMDFNLEENCLVRHAGKFKADKFEIVRIYRYEGDTDPADEATVYAIQSPKGVKGFLVTGDGIYADDVSTATVNKLTKNKRIAAAKQVAAAIGLHRVGAEHSAQSGRNERD